MTLKQSDDRINLYGVDRVVMQLKALKEIAAMAVRGKVFFCSLNSWEQRKLRRYFSSDSKIAAFRKTRLRGATRQSHRAASFGA